jgi:hypothetical protein
VGIAAASRADGSFTDLTGSSQAASSTVGDGVCDLTYESDGEQSRTQRNEAFGATQHSSGSGALGSGAPLQSRTIQVSKLLWKVTHMSAHTVADSGQRCVYGGCECTGHLLRNEPGQRGAADRERHRVRIQAAVLLHRGGAGVSG